MANRLERWAAGGLSAAASLAALGGLPGVALGQSILPDSSFVGTGVNFDAAADLYSITGGLKVGDINLLHSFERFGLATGETALFVSGPDINNIIGRVTGGSVSSLDGILAAGEANLYLINPNGITFGPNARLNLGQSFLGTTAASLTFSDGVRFGVDTDTADALLTLSNGAFPERFSMEPESGAIALSNVGFERPGLLPNPGLAVDPGESLVLIGNGIALDGAFLTAPGGYIGLTSLQLGSDVGLFEVPDESLPRQDIVLGGGSVINVSASDTTVNAGGSLLLVGNDIDVTGISSLCAGIGGTNVCGAEFVPNFAGGDAGNIFVFAEGQLRLADNSVIVNDLVDGASGNDSVSIFDAFDIFNQTGDADAVFGSIFIDASDISIESGSAVSTSTLGIGNAGVVSLAADGTVALDSGQVFSIIGRIFDAGGPNEQIIPGDGEAGGVLIGANRIVMANDSFVTASTVAGQGDSGLVSLDATTAVDLSGSFILSNIEPNGVGDALGVVLETATLTMTDGAEIQVLTRGQGDAGGIIVRASESAFLSGVDPDGAGFSTGLFTSTEAGAVGDGGDILFETPALTLIDGAVLSARTQSDFQGGDIVVRADNVFLYDGGQIQAAGLRVDGGDIRAGRILVDATERIILGGEFENFQELVDNAGDDSGRGIFAVVDLVPFIDADGTLVAPSGIFTGGGTNIGLDPTATVEGGLIFVSAPLVAANRRARIDTQTTAGDGGLIFLDAGFLALANASNVATRSGRPNFPGDGGLIFANVDFEIIASPARDNNITTDAFDGAGGNILIEGAPFLRNIALREDVAATNDISSTGRGADGVDGSITGQVLNTTQVEPVAELSPDLIDPSQLIAQGCGAGNLAAAQNIGSLQLLGRGGIAASPEQQITTVSLPESLGDLPEGESPTAAQPAATLAGLPEPAEAQTWRYGDQGQILLLAGAGKANVHGAGFSCDQAF